MLHSVTNPLGEIIPLGKKIKRKKRSMKEDIQATNIYLGTRYIMARLATMTCQERTHLLYIRGLILIFCKSVLYMIHTDSNAYLDLIEHLKSGLWVSAN